MKEKEITVPTAATDARPWYLAREGESDLAALPWVILARLGCADRGATFSAPTLDEARADAFRVCELLNDEEERRHGQEG